MAASDTIAQLALGLTKKPRAVDPNALLTADQVPAPPAAPLTEGPNRFTVRVPSHATKLSLGEGDAQDAIRFNARNGVGTESGVVAQTDAHVHVHTFGTDDPDAKTLVRLGIPSTSVPAKSSTYEAGADTGIGTVFTDAFDKWNGYAMLTQGGSYNESRYNFVVCSAEANVSIVAKKVVALSTPGDIVIGAVRGKSTADLAKNQAGGDDPKGDGAPDLAVRIKHAAPLVAKSLVTILGTIKLKQLTMAVKSSVTGPKAMESGWDKSTSIATSVGVVVGIVKQITAMSKIIKDVVKPTGPNGKVTISSSKDTVMTSLSNTVLTVKKAYSVTSQTAAIKTKGALTLASKKAASMSAPKVSISANAGLNLASSAEAHIKASKKAVVQCGSGPVQVTGDKDVQLNSVTGAAAVHGAVSSYLGAGATGPGMGVFAEASSVSMGKMSNAGMFAAPTPDETMVITVGSSSIDIINVSTTLNVKSTSTELNTPLVKMGCLSSFTLQAPTTTITGGTVYLG